MAFEFKLFGAPVQIGTFGFFDLMDSVPAAAPAQADVVAFQAKPVQAPAVFEEAALPTAA